jgi:hypothetical protein
MDEVLELAFRDADEDTAEETTESDQVATTNGLFTEQSP